MIQIYETDLSSTEHAQAFIQLLDIYAMDPMGGGQPLTGFVRQNLVSNMKQRHDAIVVLAFVDSMPAGLVNCFEGFSTFSCKPILNIHDVIVAPKYRGQGISQKMLHKVEQIAQQRGCCKLTLEVLENHTIAKAAYHKFGFDGYQLDPKYGNALFWQKKL
ncbi:MAG: GNAT family N-acetyltransferase [Gammaproteobacteria bacterium]